MIKWKKGEQVCIMSEDNLKTLEEIEAVADWLADTGNAINESCNPDAILRYACKEGEKRLREIRENMK